VSFVKEWLVQQPDDPKAQIARAWSMYNAAHAVRGAGNSVSAYYAQGMFEAAYDLSYSAYQADPTLVPASDAMVRGLASSLAGPYFAAEALEAIQTERPNWGSILRSLHEVARVSANVTRTYCKSVSRSFGKDAAEIEHRCLMIAAIRYGRTDLQPYIEEHLWEDSDPELLVPRLNYFLTKYEFGEATKPQIAWARRVLMEAPVDQFALTELAQLAPILERKLVTLHNEPSFIATEFRHARLALAQTYLADDPHNLHLLDMVEGVAFEGELAQFETEDGRIGLSMTQPEMNDAQRAERKAMQSAQKADFKKRRLYASPYSSKNWLDYARFAGNSGDPATIFRGDAALQNAVAYSDDPLAALADLISEKQIQYYKFTQHDDLPDAEKAKRPEWQTLWSTTDMTDTVLCPYLRARQARRLLCPHYTELGRTCGPAPFDAEPQSVELHERAMNAPACAGILASSLEELWYEEVPFSEATALLQ